MLLEMRYISELRPAVPKYDESNVGLRAVSLFAGISKPKRAKLKTVPTKAKLAPYNPNWSYLVAVLGRC